MTKPFGDKEKAKILVIGHDPRLINSPTLADYSFFSDYYFKSIPSKPNEKAKYKLAEALFNYILYLTSYKYTSDELFITNLCNDPLPSANGKTVYIPEDKAINGIQEIREILSNSNIKLIFAMSQQVNYWLQKLGFYTSEDSFLRKSEPSQKGINSKPPFYFPSDKDAFRLICCRQFIADDHYKIIPILHVKNWPLKKNFESVYGKVYIQLINELKNVS